MSKGLALPIFLAFLPVLPLAGEERERRDRAFFEQKVRPVLEKNCLLCHGGEKVRNGLEVTSRAALLRGGEHGPAVVPGKPERSLLIRAIRYEGSYHMPPKGKLPAQEISDLTEWVKRGAPWPASR